jgi:putative membrane protein
MLPTAGAAVFLATVPAGAQERAMGWRWGTHPMFWMGGAWGVVMMLMMLVVWGVVIGAIVLGLRSLVNPGRPSRSDQALEILRERYARGEISSQEFEAKRRDLERV